MKGRVVRRWALAVLAVTLAAGLLVSSGFGQGSTPVAAARYSLVVDGNEIASFNSLQGITTEVDVTEYMSSTDSGVTYSKLGGTQKPVVTLKRPQTSSTALWSWHEAVVRGDPSARRSVTLVMYDSDGKPVARYFLEHAFPSKLAISGVKAGSTQVLYETVTIVADHIQRVTP